ncbi:ABC-type multidrug transport system, ATPase and permease component [Rivularia sp. PCC 7116]|uniref:ABC transporter ATP-binding protein n=1 Tax=Rivularia sp. PCC 7116 TaxID=373994 RepID=UPI00029F3DA9|nr:ABC transporter ATP-binding protein [Rivularia sp. PCC 7116]AFY58060.1 ABC-type multidrug transport system, ATPase and permease component [Rivularia sp. PCC 7116]
MSTKKLIYRFAKPYPGWIILTVVLGFSGALFNGVSATLIVPVILRIVGQEVDLEGAPVLLKAIMYPFDNVPENYRLLLMALGIILTILLKNAANYASSLTSSTLTRRLTSDIRQAGVKLLLEVDIDYYSKMKVGDLINRLGVESGRAASAIRNITKLIILGITIFVFAGILMLLSWQLTIAAVLLLSLVMVVNQYAIIRSKKFGKELSEISKGYSIAMLETLNGIRLVKSTGNENKEFRRIKELILNREKADFKSQANSELIAPLSEVMGISALLGIVFISRSIFSDQISSLSAVLLTYLLLLLRTLPLLSQLNTVRSNFANTSASVSVIADFLDIQNKPFMGSGDINFTNLDKGIHFNSISFSYPNHDKLILQDVDLYLPRGTTLALVGGSGAGKSTLADLLPRFYDPNSGKIAIDDTDLKEFNLQSLRQAMGIVSQDTFLFNDSVRNNIAYGKPEADDEEVISAAKRANAYEFIIKLPQGFETTIGDRGVMLSGGQRQRLAIARALLQNPEILILDEATSALDTVSERLVQEAIDDLSRDRTTLVVAHRLSTVQKADQIAVLEQGRVVEVGTHKELLQKGGYYKRLYSMQFGSQGETENNRQQSLVKVSYEMRTRLNSMIGYLLLLIDNSPENSQEKHQLLEESYKSAWKILSFVDVFEDIFSLQKNWQLVSTAGESHDEITPENNLKEISKDFRKNTESIMTSLNLLIKQEEDKTQSEDEIVSQAYQSALHLLNELKHFEDNIKA